MTIGPGEVFLIGVACLLVIMPIASAVGMALRRRRRRLGKPNRPK